MRWRQQWGALFCWHIIWETPVGKSCFVEGKSTVALCSIFLWTCYCSQKYTIVCHLILSSI